MSSIHDGHRQRMKEEFLSGGLSSFSDHRALELLLFYAKPRADVNPLAHTLLDTFGSLAGVFDAEYEALLRVEGVGEHVATLVKLIPAIGAKYIASRTDTVSIVRSSADLQALFAPYFFGAKNEMGYLACFDNKLKLLGIRKLGEGTPDQTDLSPRIIASIAMTYNATAVVLAHNHVSGIAMPSDEDISSTLYLRRSLRNIGVDLYDHVILVDDDMVSMRESGCLLDMM